MADETETPKLRHYQKPAKTPLKAKQKAWAVNYLLTGNASQAALKAGYRSHKRGWENMEKRVHEVFLDECGDVAGIMDKTTADHLFAEAINMMKTADNDGTRARCLELAMRAKGMFVSSVEITQKGQDLPSMVAQLQEHNPQLAALLSKELGLDATSH